MPFKESAVEFFRYQLFIYGLFWGLCISKRDFAVS